MFEHGSKEDLRPKEAFVWDVLLFWRQLCEFGGQAFVFTEPGKYEVKAVTRGVESNVIEIVVKWPSRREQAVAIAMMRHNVARFIQGYWGPDMLWADIQKAAKRCERFLLAYSTSPHADFAHYRLAVFREAEYSHGRNAADRKRLASIAYAHFQAVSNRNPMLRRRAAYHQLSMLHFVPGLSTAEKYLPLKKELLTPCPEAEPGAVSQPDS